MKDTTFKMIGIIYTALIMGFVYGYFILTPLKGMIMGLFIFGILFDFTIKESWWLK